MIKKFSLPAMFRQFRAKSHCHLIHAYNLTIEVDYTVPDNTRWIEREVDIIIHDLLRRMKGKLLVDRADPFFEQLSERFGNQMCPVDGAGCEKMAESIFNAIKSGVGQEPHLVLYAVDGVTGGTDAQASAHVRLEMNGRIASGNAAEPDTLVASARAYLNAYNRLLIERGASAQGAMAG